MFTNAKTVQINDKQVKTISLDDGTVIYNQGLPTRIVDFTITGTQTISTVTAYLEDTEGNALNSKNVTVTITNVTGTHTNTVETKKNPLNSRDGAILTAQGGIYASVTYVKISFTGDLDYAPCEYIYTKEVV